MRGWTEQTSETKGIDTVKSQHVLEATQGWLQQHALSLTAIVVVSLVALKVAAMLNRKMVAKLFKGKPDEDSQKLAHTVATAMHWLIAIAIVAVALSFVLSEVGVSMDRVVNRGLDWLLSNGLGIAIILALTFVALKVATLLAAKLVAFLNRDKLDHESQKRADTLSSVIRWVLRTGILLIARFTLWKVTLQVAQQSREEIAVSRQFCRSGVRY